MYGIDDHRRASVRVSRSGREGVSGSWVWGRLQRPIAWDVERSRRGVCMWVAGHHRSEDLTIVGIEQGMQGTIQVTVFYASSRYPSSRVRT